MLVLNKPSHRDTINSEHRSKTMLERFVNVYLDNANTAVRAGEPKIS
jgi:hypothetical protein